MQSVNAAEVIDRGKIGSIKAIMEEVSGRYCQVVILVLFLFVEGQIFKYGETSTPKSLPVVINTWPFTNATAEGRIWKRLKHTIDKLNYSSNISLLYNWSSDPLRRLAELKSKSKIKNQIWVIQRIFSYSHNISSVYSHYLPPPNSPPPDSPTLTVKSPPVAIWLRRYVYPSHETYIKWEQTFIGIFQN